MPRSNNKRICSGIQRKKKYIRKLNKATRILDKQAWTRKESTIKNFTNTENKIIFCHLSLSIKMHVYTFFCLFQAQWLLKQRKSPVNQKIILLSQQNLCEIILPLGLFIPKTKCLLGQCHLVVTSLPSKKSWKNFARKPRILEVQPDNKWLTNFNFNIISLRFFLQL